MEIPRRQDGRFVAAVFAELGEEDRTDGHVHADAQRVRSADDLEQSLLRQFFHQNPVLGQKSRVMQSDALTYPALEVGTIGTGKPESFQCMGDAGLFLLGAK